MFVGKFARSFVVKNRDQKICVTLMCSRYVRLPLLVNKIERAYVIT